MIGGTEKTTYRDKRLCSYGCQGKRSVKAGANAREDAEIVLQSGQDETGDPFHARSGYLSTYVPDAFDIPPRASPTAPLRSRSPDLAIPRGRCALPARPDTVVIASFGRGRTGGFAVPPVRGWNS